jgi:hypothetical protein
MPARVNAEFFSRKGAKVREDDIYLYIAVYVYRHGSATSLCCWHEYRLVRKIILITEIVL